MNLVHEWMRGRQYDSWVNAIQSSELVPESGGGTTKDSPPQVTSCLTLSPCKEDFLRPDKIPTGLAGLEKLCKKEVKKQHSQRPLRWSSCPPTLSTALRSGWSCRSVKYELQKPFYSTAIRLLNGSSSWLHPEWTPLLPQGMQRNGFLCIIIVWNFWRQICVILEKQIQPLLLLRGNLKQVFYDTISSQVSRSWNAWGPVAPWQHPHTNVWQ